MFRVAAREAFDAVSASPLPKVAIRSGLRDAIALPPPRPRGPLAIIRRGPKENPPEA